MKQMKSLLENPHGFSVSLVFDGLFVGIFAGCISVIYRLLLNNAEKLLFTIIAFTKTRPFWIAVWFIVLIVMGLIVGWLMSWEGMASGSGIPQVQVWGVPLQLWAILCLSSELQCQTADCFPWRGIRQPFFQYELAG